MELKYLIYFVVGGVIVSATTYLAGHSKGLAAAFAANLPAITLTTFITIYLESGERAVTSYAWGLVIMLVPWLAYIFAVIFLTPRVGTFLSLAIGLSLYLAIAFSILHFHRA